MGSWPEPLAGSDAAIFCRLMERGKELVPAPGTKTAGGTGDRSHVKIDSKITELVGAVRALL